MAEDIKQYRVFIATPGGLDEEREGFRDTLRDYNEMDAVQRGVLFWPVGWEETLGGVGRPQSIINDEVRSCDYFVMVLWDRWGSSPHKEGEGKYSSGTEEEYHIALECLADEKMPMRQIVVFFKAIDERKLSDPGPQLNKVLDFKRKLETEKTIFFHTYDEIERFKKLIGKYLAQWVRDHESGEAGKPAKLPIVPKGPPVGVEEVVPVEPETLPSEEVGMSDKIKEAWRLADEGKLTDAETRFAELVVSGTDADAFSNYGNFLLRIGHLGQAEIMHMKALEIGERSASKEGLARAYGNLGLIYRKRGDLDKAEQMQKKSLEINENLGWLEGMAINYGNLGLIYQTRGELVNAEQMHLKSLIINQKLKRQKGVATNYGNLGNVYIGLADIDKAEQMHKSSLQIAQAINLQYVVASEYASLGLVYYMKGNLEEAEKMHSKGLDIYNKLHHYEGIAQQYGNLGLVYMNRGSLDEAEKAVRRSLQMSLDTGMTELIAKSHANLYLIYEQRGDIVEAKKCGKKALELFKKIGMKPEIEKMQQWIDELDRQVKREKGKGKK